MISCFAFLVVVMSYVSETIWVSEGNVSSHQTSVIVADITEKSVAISEETGTSSQQVRCSIDKLMAAMGVKSRDDLLPELKKRFGNACGYDIARKFMEDNNIEFDWWGGSN